MSENGPKNRNYCFTLHLSEEWQLSDDTGAQWITELLIPALPTYELHKFSAFQLERCPETGNLHVQGYVELTKPQRFTWIKSNWELFANAHFERRRGTRDQAIAYCEKEESRVRGPWRIGNDSGQGARTDLMEIAEKIKGEESIRSIAEQHPASFIRYARGIERLDRLIRPRRKVDWEMEVIVIWGPSGAGKTELAKRTWPEHYRFMHQRGETTWWNGYLGEETILIDEFANNFSYHYGLSILGEPGIRVQDKGGDVILYAKTIVITSMDSPTTWWPNMKEHRKALYRRITRCYRMRGDWKEGTSTLEPDYKPLEIGGSGVEPWLPQQEAEPAPPEQSEPVLALDNPEPDWWELPTLLMFSPMHEQDYGSTMEFED